MSGRKLPLPELGSPPMAGVSDVTRRRLKIVPVELKGETDSAHPLGDPTGVWYGGDWLTPADPDPLLDDISASLGETRKLFGPGDFDSWRAFSKRKPPL